MPLNSSEVPRKLPAGAEIVSGGVHFRVWAPSRSTVEIVSGETKQPLSPEGNGYFSGTVAGLKAGDLYRFRVDSDQYPDPASRFQPDGPHGPSQVIDPSTFAWKDRNWRGVELHRAVVYEMHIGTFTREGTWKSAGRELPALRDLGITVLEVMPVADFSGDFGWGYDGVNMFAPCRLYGTPDDMRSFVDTAHSLGIAVILDVVYNHFGADGNYIGQYSDHYFSHKHTTDWGDAINFDGPDSGPVREFFIANAGYWIEEFHLDGLRLDATQNIYDDSKPHILAEITKRVREAGGERRTIMIGENEPQETILVRDPARGGYGIDALWNDDFHHSAAVAMTGHNDAYYTDYLGKPQEFVSAMKYGYLYQGQRYKWQKQRRGTSARGLKPSTFVTFTENHDQVANSARGLRMHQLTTPGLFRTMSVVVLLGPGTPMLFQGQEYASPQPFYYFADVPGDLKKLVREGRQEFLAQWRTIRSPEMVACLTDPCSLETFNACKLDHSERERRRDIWLLNQDLLKLRREDPVFSAWDSVQFDGAVLSSHVFAIRAFDDVNGDRLMIVNLGRDLHLDPAPEPLLAPPDHMVWETMLVTEDPRYGGCGSPVPDSEENWRIVGHAAIVLRGVPAQRVPKKQLNLKKQKEAE